MLTHMSLFTGIGGIDLAAEWAGFTTIGQCEWADYPTKVLEKHWPDVPRWRDIREVTAESFYKKTGNKTITIITGGFPCQPFSTAGNRKGDKDDRYLWPEMLRVISQLKPTWVIGENVSGIVSMAQSDCRIEMENETVICKESEMVLETIRKDFERIGYESQPILIPACSVGARHRRDRVFILGYSKHNGTFTSEDGRSIGKEHVSWRLEESQPQAEKKSREPERASSISKDVAYTNNGRHIHRQTTKQSTETRQHAQCEFISSSDDVANSNSERLQRRTDTGEKCGKRKKFNDKQFSGCSNGNRWWSTEPSVGRVANGIPNRVDRLKCLGNAVVPYQVYPILQAIADIENERVINE